jgi:hypothetical protein
MSCLSLSELESNVLDFCARKPREPKPDEVSVRDDVLAACKRLGLRPDQTADALSTALGTLAFCMPMDRAIAAGKCRATKLALGDIKARMWPDDLPPAA